jgi:hypothetical protein
MALAIAACKAAECGSEGELLQCRGGGGDLAEEIEPRRLRSDLGGAEQRDHFEDDRVNYPHAPNGNDGGVEPILGQETVDGLGTGDDMGGVKTGVSSVELGGVGDRLAALDPPLLASRADQMHRLDTIDQELGVEFGTVGGRRQAPG